VFHTVEYTLYQRLMKSVNFHFKLLVLILLIGACTKDESENFPNVSINLTIYPGTGSFHDLGATGGSMTLEGGVNGLIIYRRSLNEFMVFDRACTNNPTDPCEKIELQDEGGFTAEDKCCGSIFLLTTGENWDGPAPYGLKRYSSYYDGSSLTIWN